MFKQNNQLKLSGRVEERAVEKGFILLICGISGSVIRFLLALIASNEILHEGLDILEDVLNEIHTG